MSYTEHTWVDGETITAAKLNNIENGIAEAQSSGAIEIVNVTFDSSTTSLVLSKTWQELHDGILAGNVYFVNIPQSEYSGWSVTKGVGLVSQISDSSESGNGLYVYTFDYTFIADNTIDNPSAYIGD